MKQPDFERNILKVLRGEKPERATLFELIINGRITRYLAGHDPEEGRLGYLRQTVDAMTKAGYDYAICHGSDFGFRTMHRDQKSTLSMNGNAMITDWESFEKYPWPEADRFDYSALERIRPYLPEGMKLMVMGPNGVLENVIGLVGYDNLCMMLYEEPELLQAIFGKVGQGLLRYYENSLEYDTVGFVSSNDDWGFNTQTFLSPADMRKYVFPWHKKIVEAAHRHGKPCLLHSCGYYGEVIEDIIEDMKFDARHSYEDKITPVEEAYEQLHGRIAVLGGIDMNVLVTSTPEKIYARSRAMLERAADCGGYALGSGNSIPDYVPTENFMAMIKAAHDMW